MNMTEEQRARYYELAKDAIQHLHTELVNHAVEIIALGDHRATTLGITQYGDISYHKPVEHLEQDIHEELADAIFYAHILLTKRAEVKES